MSKKAEILKKLKETREELKDLVKDIPPEKEIYPEWGLKELLAHFAGWDDAALISSRACLDGENPIIVAPRGADDYNSRTVTERESLPLGHIIKEWELNRELLLDLVNEISEEKLSTKTIYPWGDEGTLSNLILGMAEHELFHISEIKGLKPKLMEI
ncbi:MAG: DinB family protein [Chloroflexi bacterium]|nr:DinB family protein [Chloroflexota bacterium]